MSPAELTTERRRRKWLSVFVAVVSAVTAAALYLGITNAIDNASNSTDIKALKRPSKDELARRVVLGRRECLRHARCRREIRSQERQLNGGGSTTKRSRRTSTRTPQRHGRSPRGPNAPADGGHRGGNPPAGGGSPPPSTTPPPARPSPLPQLPLPDLGLPPLPPLPPLP